jgi:hypothetical protein
MIRLHDEASSRPTAYHPAYLVAGPHGDVERDYTVRDDTLPYSPWGKGHPRPGHWHWIRKLALKRDGWRCRTCNGKRQLEVHHRTYRNWGWERLADVTTLCSACHGIFHEKGKVA